MKKGIIIIVSILFIISIIFFAVGLYSSKKNNSNNENQFNGGEFKKTYSLKSRDMNSRYKITFPLIGDEGLSCNAGNDFSGDCSGKFIHFSAEMLQSKTKNYESIATESYSFYSENGNTVSISYVDKCLENSICFKIKNKNSDEEFHMFIGNVSDDEYIDANYRVSNGSIDEYLDYILNNIKISYDATYTIGQIKDDKLFIHFTPDTNEESYAYLDLTLDANKYKEVEYGLNTQNRTTVRTDNSENIELYFTANPNHEGAMLFNPVTPNIFTFYPYDENNKLNDKYELRVVNGKNVYYYKEYGYYNIPIDTKVLLTIAFNDKKDELLIEDFTNIVGDCGLYNN